MPTYLIAGASLPPRRAGLPLNFPLDNRQCLQHINGNQKRKAISVARKKMIWWTHQKLRASNPQARLAVVQQLALEGEAKSVGLLLRVLKDPDAEVRCAAAKALVAFQDRRAAGPLMEMLKDTEALARAAASESLGRLGDPLAIDRLVPLLRDQDQIVRAVAARSLHRLGWRPATDAQKIHQILALGNLQMLLTIGSEAVEPLLELMRYGPPNKQLAAVKTLGQIKDPRLTRSMLEALQKDSPAVRIAALDNLERIADPTTYPDVEKLLKDGNAGVRTTAVETAARCGGKRAVPELVKALNDTFWDVRRAAAKALGAIGEKTAVPGLCELVHDPDHDVREAALGALAKLNDPRALIPVVTALMDVERTVRNLAQTTLRKLNPNWERADEIREALPAIQSALSHPDYWVRYNARLLLEQLKLDGGQLAASSPAEEAIEFAPPHLALPLLADLLFDRDPALRVAAADALGRLRERGAETVLATATRDVHPAVQKAAQVALAALN